MNKVILMGNLTKDPEVRYTQSGKAYAHTGIAVTRPFNKDAVDFFNLIAWEERAETMGNYLRKGSRILVEGRMQTNSYEKNGEMLWLLLEAIAADTDQLKAYVDTLHESFMRYAGVVEAYSKANAEHANKLQIEMENLLKELS